MTETKKRVSYKQRAKAFEEALSEVELQFARTKGLLGTMVHVFGVEVMTAIRVFHDAPTDENLAEIKKLFSAPEE